MEDTKEDIKGIYKKTYKRIYKRDEKTATRARNCKYCNSRAAFRSHRRHFLEFLRTRLTGKVPFRCSNCHRRYWTIVDPRDV